MNTLVQLIRKYGDKNWDWESLAKNPNIDLKFLSMYCPDDIEKYYPDIARNPSITLEQLESLDGLVDGFSYYISEHPGLNWEFVKKYINIHWNWFLIINKKFIKWEHAKEHEELMSLRCGIENVTPEIIDNNPDVNWNYSWLSSNKNITWDYVQKHSDKEWNYSVLSYNPNITFDIIQRYPEKFNDWNCISLNPNITVQNIEENMDKPWNWYNLSENPNLTVNFIKKYRDKDWDWKKVLKYLSWRDILELSLEKHVSYSCGIINYYPYLTPELVENNMHLFDFQELSQNNLLKSEDVTKKLMKIIYAYRRYKLKKLLPIVANKYRINGEIEYMPNRGIEYFKIKDELENLQVSKSF